MTDSTATIEIKKAVATKAGTYSVKKMNMYLNADGTPMKLVDGVLAPTKAEDKAICDDFVAMGYLVLNK